MLQFDQNNLLLQQMVVELMVSRVQLSSTVVLALATTMTGYAAALLAMDLAAEPWL